MPATIPTAPETRASAPRRPPRRRGNTQAANASAASGTGPLKRWSPGAVPGCGWTKLSSSTCSAMTAPASRKTRVAVADGIVGSSSITVRSRREAASRPAPSRAVGAGRRRRAEVVARRVRPPVLAQEPAQRGDELLGRLLRDEVPGREGSPAYVVGPGAPDAQRAVGHRALLGAPVHEHRAADPPPGAAVLGVERPVEVEGGAELGADR